MGGHVAKKTKWDVTVTVELNYGGRRRTYLIFSTINIYFNIFLKLHLQRNFLFLLFVLSNVEERRCLKGTINS